MHNLLYSIYSQVDLEYVQNTYKSSVLFHLYVLTSSSTVLPCKHVGVINLWRASICGVLPFVACFHLWCASICGVLPFVACFHLWRASICGVLPFVACFHLWRASICGVLPFVACFHLWRASICGVLPFVACFHLWRASICGVLPFVVCFHLWRASICGVLPFVACFHLWCASICGVLPFVVCFKPVRLGHDLRLRHLQCCCLYLFPCFYSLKVQARYPGHTSQLPGLSVQDSELVGLVFWVMRDKRVQ